MSHYITEWNEEKGVCSHYSVLSLQLVHVLSVMSPLQSWSRYHPTNWFLGLRYLICHQFQTWWCFLVWAPGKQLILLLEAVQMLRESLSFVADFPIAQSYPSPRSPRGQNASSALKSCFSMDLHTFAIEGWKKRLVWKKKKWGTTTWSVFRIQAE